MSHPLALKGSQRPAAQVSKQSLGPAAESQEWWDLGQETPAVPKDTRTSARCVHHRILCAAQAFRARTAICASLWALHAGQSAPPQVRLVPQATQVGMRRLHRLANTELMEVVPAIGMPCPCTAVEAAVLGFWI